MLSMFPLIEEALADDGSDADAAEGRAMALKNVVAELKFQTASVIVDKRTATILERLY